MPTACRRRVPRLKAPLRVISRSLPGYLATSVDISSGGIQIRTRLPLDVGEELPLSLDLPGSPLLVHCPVRVVWSHAGVHGYTAGCMFLEPDAELERFQESLRAQK